jgi:hypothetical protein
VSSETGTQYAPSASYGAFGSWYTAFPYRKKGDPAYSWMRAPFSMALTTPALA